MGFTPPLLHLGARSLGGHRGRRDAFVPSTPFVSIFVVRCFWIFGICRECASGFFGCRRRRYRRRGRRHSRHDRRCRHCRRCCHRRRRRCRRQFRHHYRLHCHLHSRHHCRRHYRRCRRRISIIVVVDVEEEMEIGFNKRDRHYIIINRSVLLLIQFEGSIFCTKIN